MPYVRAAAPGGPLLPRRQGANKNWGGAQGALLPTSPSVPLLPQAFNKQCVMEILGPHVERVLRELLAACEGSPALALALAASRALLLLSDWAVLCTAGAVGVRETPAVRLRRKEAEVVGGSAHSPA